MTAIYPAVDSFVSSPGDTVALYHPFRAWTADGTTGYGIDCWPGIPYDHYQFPPWLSSGATLSPIAGFAPGAFTYLGGLAFRNTLSTTGEVWCTFRHMRSGGTFAVDDYHQACLFARISDLGTTANSGTPDEYTELVDCYCFGVFSAGTGGKKGFALLRANSGTITVLAETIISTGGALPPNSTTHQWLPFRLRMTLENAPTRIRCYAVQYSPSGSSRLPREFLVFDVTDASPLPTGRFGFGVQNEKLVGAHLVRVEASGFRVGVIPGSDVLVDDFVRVWRNACRTIVSPWGPNGRSLASIYTGDRGGVDSATEGRHTMQLRTVTSGAQQGGQFVYQDASQEWGWHVAQVPAQYPGAQRLTVQWQSNASSPAESPAYGIHLHGSFSSVPGLQASSAAGKTGYLALIRWSPGLSRWDAELSHYTGGVKTVLATADLGATGLALDDALLLEFNCANIGGSSLGSADGTPTMRLRIAGGIPSHVVSNWVVSPSVLGVIASGEYVYDQRSAATLGGLQYAWFVDAPNAPATETAAVNSLLFQAPLVPPAPSGLDQDTVPVASETDGAFGTFTTPLAWAVVPVLRPNRIIREVASGVRSTLRLYSRARRTWRLKTRGRTKAQTIALMDFWREHQGMTLGFNWTPPEGEAAVDAVHFATPNLPARLMHTDLAETEFELEELFDGS